jgi:hypothetical protein
MFIFGIQWFVHGTLMLGEYENASSKVGTLKMSPPKQNGDLLDTLD